MMAPHIPRVLGADRGRGVVPLALTSWAERLPGHLGNLCQAAAQGILSHLVAVEQHVGKMC